MPGYDRPVPFSTKIDSALAKSAAAGVARSDLVEPVHEQGRVWLSVPEQQWPAVLIAGPDGSSRGFGHPIASQKMEAGADIVAAFHVMPSSRWRTDPDRLIAG